MAPSSERVPTPSKSGRARSGGGASLRTKALALFLLVASVPVGIVLGTTWNGYARAIRSNEERMQLLVVRDVANDVERKIANAEGDVGAVASAVGMARTGDAGDDAVLAAIRAVLAARSSLAGVRLEIPSASASVPFVQAGMDPGALPSSTAALRAAADADPAGRTLAVDGPRAILVVRVPSVRPDQPAAYVTAPLWLAPLADDLAEAVERNGAAGADTRAMLVDAEQRVVAAYPMTERPRTGPGPDVGGAPVWTLLGDATAAAGRTSFGAAGVFEEDGAKRFGTIHSTGTRRWAVAVSRPESVALAEYHAVRAAAAWVSAAVLALAVIVGVFASRAITKPVLDVVTRVKLIGARRWRELEPSAPRGDELGTLSSAIDTMAADLQSSEAQVAKEAQLRSDLSRFLGAELVDAIVRGEHSLELGGERREVTVLFADVVAFTPIAEHGKPEVVVAMLNELFTILSEVVFRHGGTVDKFVGDSIMAVFGAPVRRDDHADRALAAAEDMVQFVETASDEWLLRYGVEVRVGIGVNSGEVVVGNIGSKKRMEYTVIGDAVNVASRLETLAAPNQVLVGGSTARLVGDRVPLRHVGERALLGRTDKTTVYELEA